MRLRLTSASPYSRKVRVTAHELGIGDRLEPVVTTLRVPDTAFWEQNPLGRVPVLETDDGHVYADSHVICEYLDASYGGHRLLPASGQQRWHALSLAAMASGIVEAAVAIRRERQRPPEQVDAVVLDHEGGKVARGLARIEREIARPMLDGERPFEHAAIASACTIGWLEFRLGTDFAFAGREDLRHWWLACVAPRESMRSTQPQ